MPVNNELPNLTCSVINRNKLTGSTDIKKMGGDCKVASYK